MLAISIPAKERERKNSVKKESLRDPFFTTEYTEGMEVLFINKPLCPLYALWQVKRFVLYYPIKLSKRCEIPLSSDSPNFFPGWTGGKKKHIKELPEAKNRSFESVEPCFSGKQVSIYPKTSKHLLRKTVTFSQFAYFFFKYLLMFWQITYIVMQIGR